MRYSGILPTLMIMFVLPTGIAFAQNVRVRPARVPLETVKVSPAPIAPPGSKVLPAPVEPPGFRVPPVPLEPPGRKVPPVPPELPGNEDQLALRVGDDGRILFVESCLPNCAFWVLIGLNSRTIPTMGFNLLVDPPVIMQDDDGKLDPTGRSQLPLDLQNAWLAGTAVYFQAVAVEFDPPAIHVSSVLADTFR